MRKFLMWFLLLNKRLYKKATFIMILALIPLAVLALGIVAKEDSGIVKIALAQEGENEPIYNDIVSNLKSSSKLIYFIEYDSDIAALEAVKTGEVDTAWIFDSELQQKISKFADNSKKRNSVVNVVTREENVVTQLTLEKLSGALYKYISRDFYINYIREDVEELENMSNEELLTYYDNFESNGTLFVFDNPTNSLSSNDTEVNYMTAPIRGLLAIISVICGFAAAMFSIDDDKKGTFAHVKQRNKFFVQFGCIAIAVLNVSIMMFISLMIARVNVTLSRELISLLIFVLCCSAFCMLMSQLLSKIHILGSVIPILTVIMFVFCPVFIDYGGFRKLQYLFAPTYYISSAYNNKYYLYAVIYFVVCASIAYIINLIKQRNVKIA